MTENLNQIPEHNNKIEICRVCLITNVKMFSLQKYELYKKYQEITGLEVSQEDKYPGFLCWECAHLLLSCHRFRSCAILSHCLLSGLIESDQYVSEHSIRKINRLKNGLVSKLKYHRNPPNYYNLELSEDQMSDKEQNGKHINDKVEITVVKNEDDDFDDDIKKESINVKEESSDDEPLSSHSENVIVIINNSQMKRKTKISETKAKRVKSKTNKTSNVKRKTSVKKDDAKKKTEGKKTILSELDPSAFDISTLTLEEQKSEIEKRKKTKNYIQSSFKCEKCYKGFVDEAAFNLHLILHTNESGEHECEVCKMHFRTPRALKRHSVCHTQKFACKHCAFTTTRCRHAKLHAEFHKGTKYECPHCYQEFSKCSTYMSHIRIKHPSDIACELCGYSFVSRRGLYLHKNLKHRFEKHQTEDNCRCEQCGINFLKKEALETHLKVSPKHVTNSEGNLVKERNCGEYQSKRKKDKKMGKVANDNKDKKREPRRRKLTQPIQCELCELQLSTATSYYRHFQRTHPGCNRTRYPLLATRRMDMCDVCGRMFQSLAALEDHMSVHGPEKQFKCPYCDKTFKRKYGVVEHLSRVHRGKKRTYGCSVCGKELNSRFNLQRHMLIHTGVREFECEMCGKLFKDVADRKLHITHVHLKVPWPKRNRGSRTKKQEPSQESEASSTNTELQPLTNTEIW